jgi:hypothetical protein
LGSFWGGSEPGTPPGPIVGARCAMAVVHFGPPLRFQDPAVPAPGTLRPCGSPGAGWRPWPPLDPPFRLHARPGKQRPPYQGVHNGRELRHSTFCCFLSAVCLALWLPSIFRRRRSFPAGRSPAGRRVAALGGAPGGGTTPPQRILRSCWAGERGPLGLPGGPNGPKNGSLWLTQAHEISSRRVDRGR